MRTLSCAGALRDKLVLVPLLVAVPLLTGCPDFTEPEEVVDAPSSIVGWKLVETIRTVQIVSGDLKVLQPGQTLTYQFVDENTILGEGLHTLATQSWYQQRVGRNGIFVELEYGHGASHHNLTFQTERTGTFDDQHFFHATGSRVRYTGTFRIEEITAPACQLQQRGDLTVWVSNSRADTRVDVTVDGLGTRSSTVYFTSAPPCDGTGDGLMRFTDVPAGSYTLRAKDQGTTTWGPTTVNVNACGCTRFELR